MRNCPVFTITGTVGLRTRDESLMHESNTAHGDHYDTACNPWLPAEADSPYPVAGRYHSGPELSFARALDCEMSTERLRFRLG
jgi:hypothetical protein